MPLTVLDHALASQLLSRLRDADTPPESYRPLTRALTQILVVEATRRLATRPISVRTPLEEMIGTELNGTFVAVPVLRAGLGMLESVMELLPQAAVGYVGLARDEATAIASAYYVKLPDMSGATALLLDPMLATGGSASRAAKCLYDAGAAKVILLCVVAAPEGVERLMRDHTNLEIVAAALDRELNDRKYILPGLGDFGDRLYGTF